MQVFREKIQQSTTLAGIRLIAGALGTGAVATSVVRFNVAAPAYVGAQAEDMFVVVDDANGGTRIRPTRVGLYAAKVTISQGANQTVQAGIGYGAIPANYTAIPAVGGTFVRDSATHISPAATLLAYSGFAVIPHLSLDPTLVIAALATNGGVAPTLTTAQCSMELFFLGLTSPT